MTHFGIIVGLIVTMLTGLGLIGTALAFTLRLLWNIRGQWDATNAGLTALVERVADLVAREDKDHARIERRNDETASRLERHLDWHDRH